MQAKIAAICLLTAFSVTGCSSEQTSPSAPIPVYPVEFKLYPKDPSSSDSMTYVNCRPMEDSRSAISCDRVTVTFERPTLRPLSREQVEQNLLLLSSTCSALDRLEPSARATGYRNLRKDKDFPVKLCFSATRKEKGTGPVRSGPLVDCRAIQTGMRGPIRRVERSSIRTETTSSKS